MALSDVAKRKLGTAMASAVDANEITTAVDASAKAASDNTFTGANTFPAGGGAGTVKPEGLLNSQVSIAGVGNAADATDDTLFTYSLPANTLNVTGKGIKIKAWGVRAAGGGNGTIKLKFGSTTLCTTAATATAADNWYLEAVVLRSGSNTQLAIGRTQLAAVLTTLKTAPGETETGAITILCTGADAGSNANKILGHGFTVEALN